MRLCVASFCGWFCYQTLLLISMPITDSWNSYTFEKISLVFPSFSSLCIYPVSTAVMLLLGKSWDSSGKKKKMLQGKRPRWTAKEKPTITSRTVWAWSQMSSFWYQKYICRPFELMFLLHCYYGATVFNKLSKMSSTVLLTKQRPILDCWLVTTWKHKQDWVKQLRFLLIHGKI